MDNFIEALYGQPEGTIPEEYDWFAPLLGDWEFDYKDKFIDGDHVGISIFPESIKITQIVES